jgi:hypothetical protein
MLNIISKKLILVFTILIFVNTVSFAQSYVKSTGIGLRGSFYNSGDEPAGVNINRYTHYCVNSTGNTGGNIFIYSRFTKTTVFEFSIGNIATVEQVSSYIGAQDVNVFGMTPILFGLRYDFLQSQAEGFLQPYLSGGLGGYLFSDVRVNQKIMQENVAVTTEIKPGIYLGFGLNIHLGSWIAFNIDGKYHLVNVNPDFQNSGTEFGFGFVFSWGNFENK